MSTKKWSFSRRDDLKTAVFAVTVIILLSASIYSCRKHVDLSEGEDCSCNYMTAPGPESNNLGPGDFNANYHGFSARMKPGEKMVMKSQFPHARYISINVYDENLRPIDAIKDYEIVPSKGANPFVPGTDRSDDYLGEFEITVLMEGPPEGERAPNTLYAGLNNEGKPNKAAFLGYRVYLVDKGLSYRDGHPRGAYGGVPSFRVMAYDKDGQPYCPSKLISKITYYRGATSVLSAFLKQSKGENNERGEPQSPPVWHNQYSREGRDENLVVGNDDTIYISTSVSNEFGELLVLDWPAPETPEASYTGAPIKEDVDMRYWSLAFAYRDPSYFAGFPTETSLSDVDVPRMPGGNSRLVIGFGGIERPHFVPEDQWVGLDMEKGIIIMRNIMVDPDYEGDFGKLPRGRITGDMARYTPGGAYCSVEELRKNPEAGIR